jgi:hypothetical protein
MRTASSFLLFSTLNLFLVRSVWTQSTEPNATDDWFYTTDGVDFTGPGTVTCPLEDYLLAACFADFFVEVNQCDNVQACAQTIELPGNASFINIAIPCDCMKAVGCAPTCTFTPGPPAMVNQTGIDLVGPGYVSCPIDDYEAFPCFPTQTSDTCANVTGCLEAAFVPSFDATLANVFIPLPCECVTATNCPTTCTLQTGEAPVVPPVSGSLDFAGPGLVMCPVSDIVQQPCLPTGSFYSLNETYTCEEECVSALDFNEYQAGDTAFTYPLWCSCMELVNCPGSCTFSDLPTSRAPATGSSTPSPTPVATTDPSPSPLNPSTSSPTSSPSALGAGNSNQPTMSLMPTATMTDAPSMMSGATKTPTRSPTAAGQNATQTPASSPSLPTNALSGRPSVRAPAAAAPIASTTPQVSSASSFGSGLLVLMGWWGVAMVL